MAQKIISIRISDLSGYVAHVGSVYIGHFSDLSEAAWMRDQWIIGMAGDFAVLNFEYV